MPQISGKKLSEKIFFETKKYFPKINSPQKLREKKIFQKMSDSEEEEEIDDSPQLIRETRNTWRRFENPRLEHFKQIIRKNQGKNQLPLKDLEFYQSKILSQIPREKLTKKLVRDFCKINRWKVNGNEHSIFNHITNHDGNEYEYEHLERFLIDDFKHFSLAYNDLHLSRKKFLNCHHVLFWLLKKNGFSPKEEDFKLLVLPQKRAEQEKIIQKIFEKNNWKQNDFPN